MKDHQWIASLNQEYADKSEEEVLAGFLGRYGDKIAFATSLGMEDQVITHMLAGLNIPVKIFTLDTGRLFPESYDLIHNTNSRYGINIDIFFPDNARVESMVNKKGINLFYESVENRKLCCHIRKVEPLKRAFTGLEAWICGLRREQSVTRQEINLVEWDENNELVKINPLINWTEEMVREFIRVHKVPYHPLHDQGYPSIGCQPCTRAILPGENVRAGRWWWENPENRECGLHSRKPA